MVEVTQLRAGTVFEFEGAPYAVLRYEHVKMGRGTATIKVKIRNLKSGATIEKAFINGARVQDIFLEKRKATYLYKQGDRQIFMDTDTYEQFEVPQDLIGEQAKFLKEGMEVTVQLYENHALSVLLPLKVIFRIEETEPGFRGNSVANIYKEATIETGARIKVPMFINIGERVLVNTDTGEYVERAK